MAYMLLSRLAVYTVLLAWIILGFSIYLFTQNEGTSLRIVQFFLSTEESGVRFRALILLDPSVLRL